MTAKLALAFVCLLTLSAMDVDATESHVYSPELHQSAEQFEYEFEWLNGTINANPYGTSN